MWKALIVAQEPVAVPDPAWRRMGWRVHALQLFDDLLADA
jgi:hypothetical protein